MLKTERLYKHQCPYYLHNTGVSGDVLKTGLD